MNLFKVTSESIAQISGRLNFLQSRHQLLNQNIANLETKDYKRKDLVFEGLVQDATALATGDTSAYTVQSHVETDTTRGGQNGNNVNLEKETWNLTDNSIEYAASVELLKKHYDMIRLAVSER